MLFKNSEKNEYISLARILLKRRIAEDPVAKKNNYSSSMVDNLSDVQISSLAESTIASIVESITKLNLTTHNEVQSIKLVEAHRERIGYGSIPASTTISYVHYRVSIEYPEQQFQDGHIDWCINVASHYFQNKNNKISITQSIEHGDHLFLRNYLVKILESLEVIFEPDAIGDEEYSYLVKEVEKWKEKKSEIRSKRAAFLLRAKLREM